MLAQKSPSVVGNSHRPSPDTGNLRSGQFLHHVSVFQRPRPGTFSEDLRSRFNAPSEWANSRVLRLLRLRHAESSAQEAAADAGNASVFKVKSLEQFGKSIEFLLKCHNSETNSQNSIFFTCSYNALISILQLKNDVPIYLLSIG